MDNEENYMIKFKKGIFGKLERILNSYNIKYSKIEYYDKNNNLEQEAITLYLPKDFEKRKNIITVINYYNNNDMIEEIVMI